jgi:hypothetical protein
MSGFKSTAIIVSNKATTVTPDISGNLSIVARNNHLQVFNGTIEEQVVFLSELGAISGGLNTLIGNEVTNRTNADLLLTPLTTTADISGGLNSRLTTVEGNYATKGTPVAGTYNNVVVNSQGIVTSGGVANYSSFVDLTPYTLLSTTADISGNLQSQITAIVQEGTTIASSGGSIVTTQVGTAFNLEVNDYISKTQVTSISGGLDTRLSTVEGNYATKATPVAGTYNSVVVNSQGIVTSGGLVSYALSGRTVCTTANEYIINHATIDPVVSFPLVSLECANVDSEIFALSIFNRAASSFRVVLSGNGTANHALIWHIIV